MQKKMVRCIFQGIQDQYKFLQRFDTMRSLLILVFLLTGISGHAQTLPHHQLNIEFNPEKHSLKAKDHISLPLGTPRTLHFFLHRDLNPVSPDAAVEVVGGTTEDWMQRYRITLPGGSDNFTLIYGGEIFHPPQQDAREARTFENSPGIISAEGAVLSGVSGWYPDLENMAGEGMLSFSLDVKLPQGWSAVSQGNRAVSSDKPEAGQKHVSWQEMQAQGEIFLIAAPFTEYLRSKDGIEMLVYLRKDDAALAQRYLEATARYISNYRELIGTYPYAKFALVENFWETGYGMPSFTLLGSQVIRLPFIIDSSYPHEILHNWWGNGVYVDYQSGNWSEGLTAYMADHMVQEQKGAGAEYRRGVLQKYADFVTVGRDFPLAEFTSRHSAQSEAVGYGKTMLLFHMLRRRIGDEKFILALQSLYRGYKFKRAGFADIESTFSRAAGEDLGEFFSQWVQRAGAPELKLVAARTRQSGTGYELTIQIEQIQQGLAYTLDLPLIVTLEGKDQAYLATMKMKNKREEFRMMINKKPLRVDLDPEFDLFRRLESGEIPPALSQLFGAEQLLIVLPRKAPEALRKQYFDVATNWQKQPGRSTAIAWDDELKKLPEQGAVWLFGWENRWRTDFQRALALNGAVLTDQGASFGSAQYSREQHTFALTARMGEISAAWAAVPDAAMMPVLARKLPHYSKFSYAIFGGEEVANLAKGTWLVARSPLAMPVRQQDGSILEVMRGSLESRNGLAH